MSWRLRRADWERDRGAKNRHAFRTLVHEERAQGVLAFQGERAVGWCSVGPRQDFVALESKPSLRTEAAAGTWSVTCFFLSRDQRGRGLSKRLLRAAVEVARAGGATRLEGYPAPPPKAGGRLPAAFAWTGLPGTFEACGFRALAETPGKRPIYVKRFAHRRSAPARPR